VTAPVNCFPFEAPTRRNPRHSPVATPFPCRRTVASPAAGEPTRCFPGMSSDDADRDKNSGYGGRRPAAVPGLDPGRRVHDGIRHVLSGGTPGTSGCRRHLLDGNPAGHGGRLPPVCDRHQLPHGRRAAAERRRLRGRGPRHASAGLAGVPPRRRAGRSPELPPGVGVRRVPVAEPAAGWLRGHLARQRFPGQSRSPPG